MIYNYYQSHYCWWCFCNLMQAYSQRLPSCCDELINNLQEATGFGMKRLRWYEFFRSKIGSKLFFLYLFLKFWYNKMRTFWTIFFKPLWFEYHRTVVRFHLQHACKYIHLLPWLRKINGRFDYFFETSWILRKLFVIRINCTLSARNEWGNLRRRTIILW